MLDATWAVSGIPQVYPEGRATLGFDIVYPETQAAGVKLTWYSQFLDAVGELGSDAGFVAFGKKIGAPRSWWSVPVLNMW